MVWLGDFGPIPTFVQYCSLNNLIIIPPLGSVAILPSLGGCDLSGSYESYPVDQIVCLITISSYFDDYFYTVEQISVQAS